MIFGRKPLRALCLLLVACAHGAPSSGSTDPSLEPVAFITGDWMRASGPERVEEHWLPPHAGTMFGVSRTADGDRTVFFEYLRIEKQGDAIVYLSSPKGRDPPTPFTLVKSETNRAVFENPSHDHPQRVSYWIAGGKLHAAIEMLDGSKRSEWVFTRR
jgi:hypothetical protein